MQRRVLVKRVRSVANEHVFVGRPDICLDTQTPSIDGTVQRRPSPVVARRVASDGIEAVLVPVGEGSGTKISIGVVGNEIYHAIPDGWDEVE